MPDKPQEEYLLYVRVPDPEDQTDSTRNDFLERLAALLSDEAEHIYVEPYTKDDVNDDNRGERDTHGRESGIKARGEDHFKNSVSGENKNSLQPMYFCHNKF